MPYRLCAAAAGVAYAISGAAVIGHHVPDSHWGTRGALVDAAGALAFVLTAAALTGLAPILTAQRIGRIATRVAQIGLTCMTVESIASLVHGGNILGALFSVGLLLTLAGTAALGYTGLRARLLPWTSSLPFVALLVGIAAGDHGGFVATGIVWLILAAAPVEARQPLARAAA